MPILLLGLGVAGLFGGGYLLNAFANAENQTTVLVEALLVGGAVYVGGKLVRVW
jgi:hypothetical protein